jgi:UDP-N-acetylglucosamine--N-acetylmuramyl-(pentapeptide) pyrophosphoryl-undecaprenol N-acetylglucosamine transferase
MKKILITAGGTGGHIYPALALARQFEHDPAISVLFVGGNLETNPYFDRARYPYKSISCGPIVLKNPLKILKNMTALLKGFFQARQAIQEFKPDLVIGFGSYHTAPVLLAAKMQGVPFLLHEANAIPGKVVRFFAKHAKAVGVHFTEAKKHLIGKVLEVRLPLREGYQKDFVSKIEARKYFNLEPEKTTLLVFGGSQGAKAINHLFSEAILKHFKSSFKEIQILHFTGDLEEAEKLQKSYQDHAVTACVKKFESRMDYALQAADLMISRAGAGTIAEQTEFEVAGLFIPYPFAADQHQDKNAAFVVDHGGGVVLSEGTLTPSKLSAEIDLLLQNRVKKIVAMQKAVQEFKKQASAMDLYTFVRIYIGAS